MEPARQLLFGEFPRRVGVPEQFWVYSEEHWERVMEKNIGRNSIYATISWIDRKLRPVCDKVSLDLDAPVKESEWGIAQLERMFDDAEFAEEVLGPICDDVIKLGEWLVSNQRPGLAVFTGFGVHVHLLYQPVTDPYVEMESTGWWLVDQLDLETADPKVIGDVQRILRVPNVKRVQDGTATDVWTVPITPREMVDVTPEWLLDVSMAPRAGVEIDAIERPEMKQRHEYLRSSLDQPIKPAEIDISFDQFNDEYLATVLKELLKMPCMYEGVIQASPPHSIRRNMAVMLYNIGLTPDDVFKLIKRLGWSDFDPAYTKRQLEQIHQTGYSDMSCTTIQHEGLCTRIDEDCPTRGWSGGRAEWKESKL